MQRDVPICTDHYYHVMNHITEDGSYFSQKKIALRFMQLLQYYRSTKTFLSYSRFMEKAEDYRLKQKILFEEKQYFRVTVFAYCIMPTHFHLLLKQETHNGISDYLSFCENAIAKYVNTITGRSGRLFRSPFKHVHIDSDTQFLHVSRYIHNNPYVSSLVAKKEQCVNYDYSSLREYVATPQLCDTIEILSYFSSPKSYVRYVISDSEEQRLRKVVT